MKMDMSPSPRSVTTKASLEDDDDRMQCDDEEEAPGTPEMPSFLPSLIIEALGYPAGLGDATRVPGRARARADDPPPAGALVVCQAWRQQAERIFRRELSELRCASHCRAEYLALPPTTKSTISVAFSPDLKRFASTHGDHTVKVVDFESGRVAATLVGHPRTPWTVKFHPFLPDVVASGCLGFEARVWDARERRCVRRAEFDRAIISLSFHPAGDILAVAAGTSIYLWHYATGAAPRREFTHPHPIRCLRFLPSRDAIIVGAANNGANEGDAPRITFQLMLCDFDVEAARRRFAAALGRAVDPREFERDEKAKRRRTDA